jgi:hypothetical protein
MPLIQGQNFSRPISHANSLDNQHYPFIPPSQPHMNLHITYQKSTGECDRAAIDDGGGPAIVDAVAQVGRAGIVSDRSLGGSDVVLGRDRLARDVKGISVVAHLRLHDATGTAPQPSDGKFLFGIEARRKAGRVTEHLHAVGTVLGDGIAAIKLCIEIAVALDAPVAIVADAVSLDALAMGPAVVVWTKGSTDAGTER